MKNAVVRGPLLLVGTPQAANLPQRAFEPHGDRYGAIKLLAVVRGPHDVTVTIPMGQRDSVSLLYDPDARANEHGFLFAAGDARVTFEACSEREPQYNGGFIATMPGCVSLDVESKTSSASGWVSLGARRSCPE